MIYLQQIKKQYGSKVLFSGIDFHIRPGDKIGLVRVRLHAKIIVTPQKALIASKNFERVAHADAQIDLIRDMLHAKNQGWEE